MLGLLYSNVREKRLMWMPVGLPSVSDHFISLMLMSI
jgi:hypothetical protein